MPVEVDTFTALAGAIHENDTALAATLLAQHPELRSRLNDPIPGGAFGARVIAPAVDHGNHALIDLLISHGASINSRSDWWAGGFGVLDGCDPALAPFLIDRGARLDAHAAARLGLADELRALIAADPNVVNERGGDGQTPLHFASTEEVASLLLEAGADINAMDVDHESTPAQWMVRDRQDVARFLLTRGCRSDILMASALGDIDLVRRHLDEAPASIHTRVDNEHFPMRDARAGGSIYIWTIGKSKTAHAAARENGQHDIVALLMERSPDALALSVALDIGDEQLARTLLSGTPGLLDDLRRAEPHKLVDAAEDENARGVRLMLDAGWPADSRGRDDATALHYASWLGDAEMAEDLLRFGAPIEAIENTHHGTPLGWAFHGSQNCGHRSDHAAVVEALLTAGAKLPAVAGEIDASEAVCAVIRRHHL